MTVGALVLDGIVVASLIFFAVWGGKKGLVRAVFGIFTGILGLLLTWKLYPYMAQLLTTCGLKSSIQTGLAERLSLSAATSVTQQTEAINALALPGLIRDWLVQNNNYEAYGALGVSGFGEYVTGFLANLAVNILAVLLTFILSLLLVRIVSGLLGLMNKLPVIGKINRILGVAAGIAIGLLVVWGLLLLVTFLGLSTSFASLMEAIENSKISAFLYKHNLLMELSLKVFH